MLIGALMAGFSLAVLIAGEPVMRLLFHGPEFEGLGHTLTVLALAMLAGAVGMPASNALAAMERPLWILAAGTVGAVLTVVLVWLLLEEWGLLGAAYGFLAGNIAGTVGRWIAFFVNVPKLVDTKHLMRALEDFTEVHGDRRWTITGIGEGRQAEVFAINSSGQRPIWRTYHTLVAKLYKPGAAFTLERAQAQFQSLTSLHAALDGREINGWRISVPRPLHVCKSPLALVMTAVSGRHLDYYALKKEADTPTMLRDAACAFAAALQQYWSSGQRHGDLTLDNVLFDDEAKQISFIDAEMIDHSCSNDTKRFTMASELATLLSGIVTDVMDTLGNQTGRILKEVFVEDALCAIIGNAGSEDDKRRLLNDISHHLREHLVDCLEVSLSPQGMWHWFARHVATKRACALLTRVSSKCDIRSTNGEFEFLRPVRLNERS